MDAATSSNPAPIRIVFRYRDLVAPTLTEHQKIIEAEQKCWWGWWKRPSEDGRLSVWDYLQQELSLHPGNPLRIGLFDSGLGVIRAVWIDEVRRPRKSPDGEWEQIQLTREESALVPPYYRKSPFSRAWMRLVKIEESSLDFFGIYSLDEPPPLPQYSPAILDRLKGKVLLDADELRGMDTTIWRVRPRQDGDSEKEFYAAAPSITGPLDAKPVHTNGSFILHLTDPHFAAPGKHRSQHQYRLESELFEDVAKDTLAEAVIQALDSKQIGAIVISGDLTFVASPEEFAEARRFIGKLIGKWNLGPEHVVVVPGNHDVGYRKGSTEYTKGSIPSPASKEGTEAWRTFYRHVFNHDANARLSMGRRFAFPHGGFVEICGVNSSTLDTGKNFLPGIGRIDESAFVEIANAFGWSRTQPSLALRVLAIHHHLTATENLDRYEEFEKGLGMAIDAPRVQRLAASRGVQLAVHGHKHRAFLWRSTIYELPEKAEEEWNLGELSILGGGSAGSSDTESKHNFFNLIEVSGSGLTLQMYRAQNGGPFASMAKWQAAFTLSEGRLVLGAWQRSRKAP